MFDLLLVPGVDVVPDKAYHRGIIGKLYQGFGGVGGDTVSGEEGEECWTKNTPLWCACVHDCGAGCQVPHPDILRPVGQEVHNP